MLCHHSAQRRAAQARHQNGPHELAQTARPIGRGGDINDSTLGGDKYKGKAHGTDKAGA